MKVNAKKARKKWGRGGEQTVAQVEELVVGSDLGACRSGLEALEHVRGLAQQEHGHAAQVQHGRPHHQLLLCQALLLIIIVILLVCCCGGSMGGSNCGCGCGNNCGCNNNNNNDGCGCC